MEKRPTSSSNGKKPTPSKAKASVIPPQSTGNAQKKTQGRVTTPQNKTKTSATANPRPQQNSSASASRPNAASSGKTGKGKLSESKIMIAATLLLLAGAFLYRAAGCSVQPEDIPDAEVSGSDSGNTTVHFLDVGQGDSTLIQSSKGTVLIDGGERDQGDTVLADLRTYGVTTIDYMIATHPHSDHIGGLVDVLNYAAKNDDLTVKSVIIPEIPAGDIPTSSVYKKFLTGVKENDISITYAEYGMKLNLGSSTATLYPAIKDRDYGSLNDYSVCTYLDCGEVSFFFVGDMESPEEKDLLASGMLQHVQATVFKAGHHGSNTSSSQALLNSIQPKYAVISCGTGNKYGHPGDGALKRLYAQCDEVYRTDKQGTVSCTTDGTHLAWKTEKGGR